MKTYSVVLRSTTHPINFQEKGKTTLSIIRKRLTAVIVMSVVVMMSDDSEW